MQNKSFSDYGRMKQRGSNSKGIGLKKGAWTAEEDMRLKNYIEKYGEGKWHLIPLKSGKTYIYIYAYKPLIYILFSVHASVCSSVLYGCYGEKNDLFVLIIHRNDIFCMHHCRLKPMQEKL